MAEGILKKIAGEKGLDLVSSSAGIFAEEGNPPAINAVDSLGALGINIRDHRSQRVTAEVIDKSDLILTMTSSHKEMLVSNYPDKKYKIFMLNEYAFGKARDIQDPYGGNKQVYDRARDEIIEAIEKIYKHI